MYGIILGNFSPGIFVDGIDTESVLREEERSSIISTRTGAESIWVQTLLNSEKRIAILNNDLTPLRRQ
jgi:hypothetical protein